MKWFLDLPQVARIALALAVVATVFIWVYVLVQEREEHELVFDDTAVTWPEVPLFVTSLVGQEEEIVQAVSSFNDQVGCEVFRFVEGMLHANVLIFWEGNCDSRNCYIPEEHKTAAAGTWIAGEKAWVVVRQLPDPRTTYLIVQHELGHVLGLAHDSYGLMKLDAPGQQDTVPRLTTKDSQALYHRYCLRDGG